MSDLRKRPNPENVKRIESYIAKIRAEINETSDLVNLKSSDGWEKILVILNRKLAALDFDLDQFSSLPDKDIYATLQARKDINYFISLIEGGEQAMVELNEKLDEAVQNLVSLKKRLGIK